MTTLPTYRPHAAALPAPARGRHEGLMTNALLSGIATVSTIEVLRLTILVLLISLVIITG
ncbi:hypothetical protein AWN76_007765 [Rhodothermaceae bacterium RA]|nr:hypothetical protein AWN76_007765 [Rhodothermaceae bacterium RA]